MAAAVLGAEGLSAEVAGEAGLTGTVHQVAVTVAAAVARAETTLTALLGREVIACKLIDARQARFEARDRASTCTDSNISMHPV